MNMIALLPLVALPGVISIETAFGSDIVQMILHAGLMVKFVMFILFLFSVVSWTIIFMKWRLLRRGKQETEFFLELFWEDTALNEINSECQDLGFSPVAHLFKSGYDEIRRIGKIQGAPSSEAWHSTLQTLSYNVERALKKATIEQSNRLEKALSFLATTGNTAPFIGLFGTVWGIMESFRGIGMKGSASLAVVAPGISEALIATAAGLAAAIPAVVAFNYFNHKVIVARSEMDTFSSDFLSMVERQIFKKRMGSNSKKE
jgi:biopolymer transport protein TolQ